MARYVNDLIELSIEEINGISEEELLRNSYGIQFFDFRAAGLPFSGQRDAALRRLYDRLMEVKAAKASKPAKVEPEKIVRANCGHYVRERELMTASLGTCCQDCYDKMSD